MSNILVTGASGFIGKSLIAKLLKRKEQVHAIVMSNTHPLKKLLGTSRVYRADLSNYSLIEKIITKIMPQIIFHLAAYPDKGNDLKDIQATFRSNVLGTLNLLMASNRINYENFVFAGSFKEYGDQPVPFKENYRLNPLSSYATSKAAAEQYCDLFQSFGKPITRLRLATIYGPGQDQNTLISSVIKSALSNKKVMITTGEQTRDFLYVGDAVNALIKSAIIPSAKGEVYNIGSGSETRIADIVEKIVRLCKSNSQIRKGAVPQRINEVMHMYGDVSKAKKKLRWEPKTNLNEGLLKTIEWFRNTQV